MHLDRSTFVVLAFAVTFAIFGIKEMLGYPISASYMLMLSIWSFSASLIQIMETIMSFFPKCKEKIFEEICRIRGEDKEALDRARQWYSKRKRNYEYFIDIVFLSVFILGLCWFIGEFEYENNALANGLTLLSISFIFLSMVIREYAVKKIADYKVNR